LKTQQRFSVFGLSWNTAKICCGGFLNNDAPSLSTQQLALAFFRSISQPYMQPT
jgi:hypothetical protein